MTLRIFAFCSIAIISIQSVVHCAPADIIRIDSANMSNPMVNYTWADNHEGRMLNLLRTGAGADLLLLIGPEKTPIKVHSLILMAGSQVFRNKLDINAESEGALPRFRNTVHEVKDQDEDPEIFKIFLDKLYTGNCGVKITQALKLLRIATNYGVKDLIAQCSEILQGNLNDENVLTIFSQAMEYFDKELIESSLEYICKNASAVLKSEDFANLRLECLVEILKQDDLKVTNEMEVFTSTYRWGEAECQRQKLDAQNPKDMRKVLSKALAYIRFPNMRQSEFAMNVATKNILDEGELMSLMISFMVLPSERSKLPAGRFMSTPRAYTDSSSSGLENPNLYVSRLGPINQSLNFCYRAKKYSPKRGCFTETLLFSVSQAVKFRGIKIAKKMFCFYDSSYPERFNYKLDDIFLNMTLSKVFGSLKLAEKEQKFDYEVCLDTSTKLEASQLYKIHYSYSGPIQYKQNDVAIELYNAKKKNQLNAWPQCNSSAQPTHPISFTSLTEATVKASTTYPLHVGIGYESSKTFTARNSIGELETITVEFSREDGDNSMDIAEGFIEKLIFQME